MIDLIATKCPWCDGLGYTDSDDSPHGTSRCQDCGGTGMQAVERSIRNETNIEMA